MARTVGYYWKLVVLVPRTGINIINTVQYLSLFYNSRPVNTVLSNTLLLCYKSTTTGGSTTPYPIICSIVSN
jgi:hypothetical protein